MASCGSKLLEPERPSGTVSTLHDLRDEVHLAARRDRLEPGVLKDLVVHRDCDAVCEVRLQVRVALTGGAGASPEGVDKVASRSDDAGKRATWPVTSWGRAAGRAGPNES